MGASMPRGPARPERSFGLSCGGVLCVLAGVLVWRGRFGRAEVLGGVGAILILIGLTYPRLLAWPSAAWWRVAGVLGYVNSRVLLCLVFMVVMAPLNAISRLVGRDPLAIRRERWPGWSPYPARYRDRKHYVRLY
jgi:hypothetical protein